MREQLAADYEEIGELARVVAQDVPTPWQRRRARLGGPFMAAVTALLVAAFALDRPDLLRTAMSDHLHQPYRKQACPLLPLLLPLAGKEGIFGVSLSGAGPSVLLIADNSTFSGNFYAVIRRAAGDEKLEIIETKVASGAQVVLIAK